MDAQFIHPGDRGFDDVLIFHAHIAVFTGMRIDGGDADSGGGNAFGGDRIAEQGADPDDPLERACRRNLRQCDMGGGTNAIRKSPADCIMAKSRAAQISATSSVCPVK